MRSYEEDCEKENRLDWWDEYVQALEYIRDDEV